jgi:hypothetical protein
MYLEMLSVTYAYIINWIVVSTYYLFTSYLNIFDVKFIEY